MGNTVDKSTFGGIVIALLGIGYGLVLDGGKISQIIQPTAALIVVGGTIGAVMVQFPLSTVLQAIRHLKDVFLSKEPESDAIIQNLLRYALKARKEGILSLDSELAKVQDPFLKESLMLAIDGVNATDLRKMMELQLDYRGEKDERIPKVFESAAGFAPTIGIIGAVLGLIQVMQKLQDINEVGKGHRGRVCRDHLWRSLRQFVLTAVRREAADPHSGAGSHPGDDAGGSSLDHRRSESARAGDAASPVCEFAWQTRPPKSGLAMSRIKHLHAEEAASHERWLLSYSDFITLLFAFFVVLYATTYHDKQSIKKLSHAIHNGFQSMGAFTGDLPGSKGPYTGSTENLRMAHQNLRTTRWKYRKALPAPWPTCRNCARNWKPRWEPSSRIMRLCFK